MAVYKVFKETALPGTLQPHSIYLIAPAARPNYVEMYVTGTSEATVKRIINEVDVQALIDASMASVGGTVIVDDITARNAISSPANGTTVLVLDASADGTVVSGAATYIYRTSNTTWYKISEAESLDLSLTWAALQDKPTSAVADIDDAVTKRHTHANKTELDKIGEDGNGDMTYNGGNIRGRLESTGW